MRLGVLTVTAVLVCATAEAHVRITPRESKAGATETYTARVPTEGKVTTTAVELEVPEGVTIVSVTAPTGATYDVKRDRDRIVSVTWKTDIKPGEFAELTFVARNPREGAQITWKAHQRYADGTSSDWVGAAGTRAPAPVVTLLPATKPAP